MRGKGMALRFLYDIVRITPAYAGKSFLGDHRRLQFQDHPRLCGEKPEPRECRHREPGSPPPMRGKAVEML